MPTYTTTYSLGKPVVGADEDAWGDTLNASLDSIDDILDGTTPVTGIDINSGTLDGVTIGGTTAGAGTFTTLTANTSITGTLATAAQPNITSVGSLTSLDVAGTLTSDEVIVQQSAFTRALVGSTGANGAMLILDGDSNGDGSGGDYSYIYHNTSGQLEFLQNSPSGTNEMLFNTAGNNLRMKIGSSGDISFYEDTGTTAKFFWDASAESLGIGNTTPSTTSSGNNQLVLGNATTSTGMAILSGTASDGTIAFNDTTTSINRGLLRYSHSSDAMRIYTAGSERMRIDSSGNVGIGTSSPQAKAEISGGLDNRLRINSTDGTASNNYGIDFSTAGTVRAGIRYNAGNNYLGFYSYNNTERMRIDASGNVGIGTTSPSSLFEVNKGSAGTLATFTDGVNSNFVVETASLITTVGNTGGSTALAFKSANTERMRIDSSGNLLVGTTDTTVYNNSSNTSADNGFQVNPNGWMALSSYQQTPAFVNRTGNDGDLISFTRSGTTVGSIGIAGGDLYISGGSSHAGIRFDTNILTPAVNGTQTDATVDLGYSSQRFKDLYLSGGVYLGGTGSANKLDDYEEGTFTPVVRGRTTAGTATYSRQGGFYTKIGRTVTIHMNLGWSSHTGTGGMEITLPFATGGDYQAGGFMSYNSGMQYGTATGDILSLWMDSSSSNMRVYYYNRAGGTGPVAVNGSVSEIHLQIIYNTA